MESIYDSLVGEDDRDLAVSGGPGAPNVQQYPPWFHNFPGFTPQELAELVWRGKLPPHVEQVLRARQADFMKQLGASASASSAAASAAASAGPAPPVPSKLLNRSNEAINSVSSGVNAGGAAGARSADLFDRHHHMHLVYWKRAFKHMSADEVDALIAQQRLLLKNSTYAEDYFYQQTTAKLYSERVPPKSVPPLMGVHRPICLEPLEHPARALPDMQAGTLGKLAFSTLKGPKPLVQLNQQTPEPGPHRFTSSKAIQLLEAGQVNAHVMLSVLEDGLVLALQIGDMAGVLPQLPAQEQGYFLNKQQHLVGALVYILNVFVARREDGSCLFPAMVKISKGRQLVVRCLSVLPLEQRSALLLFCLSQVQLLASLPADARTRALHTALARSCGTVVGSMTISLLQAVGQAFSRQADFADWAASEFGASVLGELLGSLLRARPPPGTWEPVAAGLVDALMPGMAGLAALDPAHRAIQLLLNVSYVASPQQVLIFTSLVRPVLADARVRYAVKMTLPMKQLLERLSL